MTAGRVTVTKYVPKTRRHHNVVVGATGIVDHNNPRCTCARTDG
jgi:hypothetical protein